MCACTLICPSHSSHTHQSHWAEHHFDTAASYHNIHWQAALFRLCVVVAAWFIHLCLRRNKRDWGTGDFWASLSLCSAFRYEQCHGWSPTCISSSSSCHILSVPSGSKKASISRSNNKMSEWGLAEKLHCFRKLFLFFWFLTFLCYCSLKHADIQP